MKLLFTGCNGFLGKNTIDILRSDYEIIKLDLIDADICCNLAKEQPNIKEKVDIVLHAAGKAHIVPRTAEEKQTLSDINLKGTKHLTQALEQSGIPKAFIFISTVAVYGLEKGDNITEDHPLQGDSPYALSKIQAEKHLIAWCKKHAIKLSILRPSLIAGPNPPGNLEAMIKGIKSGKYLSIAGGKARKSVLMVQDIARLIPLVVDIGGIYNVCDSQHPSFAELEHLISKQLGKSHPLSIPLWLAKILAKIGDLTGKRSPINSNKLSKITEDLTFSNEKIKQTLNWEPLSVLKHFKIQ